MSIRWGFKLKVTDCLRETVCEEDITASYDGKWTLGDRVFTSPELSRTVVQAIVTWLEDTRKQGQAEWDRNMTEIEAEEASDEWQS